MLKLIQHLYVPNSGEIQLFGRNTSLLGPQNVRKMIAYVPQEGAIYNCSIAENIRFGKLNATREEIMLAAEKAQVHDLIMGMPEGYDTVVGEQGSFISGGQRQRITIARAILKDAPILLLDEATSALDTDTELLLQRTLNELYREKTIIAVAHRLSTVRNADRIFLIEGGDVAGHGTHHTLLAQNGRYARLFSES